MRSIVDGKTIVTLNYWSVKRDDGGLATGPNKDDPSNYVGPALFLDKASAYVYMHELGIPAEPIPVLVEIREVSLEEFKEFERKDRL